ncbi:hypothetical protein RZS28_10545 [Methylocapsa polymorpha]|uniref:Uncharacterized protein n=1 Tax=Methylocapsa polymorpha TaxID=3080828 RepID=A0ABZ0HP37_9HYPH|nr:hypothetical protein RZS28_10545 [Methylocapsa sp. RX1]
MTKENKPRQQPISSTKHKAPQRPSNEQASMAAEFSFDPKGKQEPVDIESSKDGWSEYTLADGSVIRLKAVLMDVKKAVGQYDLAGDPIYVIQSALVNQVRAPDHLKKKS